MISPATATILYLHSSDDLYGADMILLQIVRGLDRSRFTPIVVLPDDMRHVALLSRELEAAGIEWMHLPIAIVRRSYFSAAGFLPFLARLVRGTWAVRRLARTRNVRLIHGFTLAVAAAPLAAVVLRLPLIMHVHEIIQRPRLLRKLLHAVGVRRANGVICVSDATRRNVLEDEPSAASRVRVIHNGIARRAASAGGAGELRSSLGVAPDRPLIGMIGRVSPWKGQEVFLQAAALVLANDPHCQFIAIGGVFDREVQHLERLLQLHASLNLGESVTISGFRKDARDLLPAFDIFVLPSTSPDPFPTVVLEAMSAGVPVIATDHGGAPEMVVEGVTGLLIPPGDSAALSSAIQRLLADPERCARMGEAGRARVLEHFEVSRYLMQIQELYTSTLDPSAARMVAPAARTLDRG